MGTEVENQNKWINIFYYFQGTIREKLFYSKYRFLIRKHIQEQIVFRIEVMKEECFYSGSCVKCGCRTTALQMCNKSCEGNCYPPLVSKKVWNYQKNYISL